MKSFLKVADARKLDNDVARTAVAEIRELAYDVEDMIETFALKVASQRKPGFSNCLKRSVCFLKKGCLLHRTRSEIEKITVKIQELTRQLNTYDVTKLGDHGEGPSSSSECRESRQPYPHVMDDNVVGMDDDIKELVSVLVEERGESKSNASSLSSIQRARRVSAHEFFQINCIKSPMLRSLLFFDGYSFLNAMFQKLDDHFDRGDYIVVIAILFATLFGPFEIKDFNANDSDKNPPIIEGRYLHSLSIIHNEGRIDPRHLNHLLSSCVSVCKLSLDVEISELPEYVYSSSYLAYLNLRMCKLKEDPMPTLEKLPSLRVLELHALAFEGKEVFCSTQGFPKLESLTLFGLHNLEEWKVDDGAMPRLWQLGIEWCQELKMVPDGLRYITMLQELEIKSMPNVFIDKLVEGGEDFYKVQHVPSRILKEFDEFELLILSGGEGIAQ
ncbi:hypothetical protein V6N11_079006 [Hibiscus sabdariffa]|uniref:Rx N-terminal domain-containing protein n=1 Tax=Hibiscus sabdariffa TaxID=183260 RepID=A0ABR2RU44_9ROSI